MNPKDVLRALEMAAPFAVLSRYEDYQHCVETSISGAKALKVFGLKANPILCSVVLLGKTGVTGLSIGHTPKSLYETHLRYTKDLPPFEEWVQSTVLPPMEKEYPLHAGIQVRYRGGHAFVDLTLGQGRLAGFNVPLSVVHLQKGWPVYESKNFLLVYGPCPHPEKHPSIFDGEVKGLEEDFCALMHMALDCKLNIELYHRLLCSSQPELCKIIDRRLHESRRTR